jgi:hypothetical protein
MAFQSPRATNIIEAKNVTQFESYMTTKTNRVFGISPISASTATYSASLDNPFPNIPTGSFGTSGSLATILKNAGSSSKDINEIIGLIDVRLNPQLYKKYKLNYALSTGSSYNEAVMWADNQ